MVGKDAQKSAKRGARTMTLSLAAPPWVVGLIGFSVVLSGIAYFFWRVRRARQVTRNSAARGGGR
jgi:hypothetical protein